MAVDLELTLPIIDFASFVDGKTAGEVAVAHKLVDAFKNRGFAYLQNHGIPQDKIDKMFEFNKAFYALPFEIKDKIRRPPDGRDGRGWVAPGAGKVTDGLTYTAEELKKARAAAPGSFEFFLMGTKKHPYLANRFPPEEALPGLADAVEDYIQTAVVVYNRLFRAIAIGLGLEPTFFDKFNKNGGNHSLSLNHYVPGPADQAVNGRLGAHTDYGFLTLLLQDKVGGLEVHDAARGNDYVPAAPVPGCAIINVGDMLSQWSNGILKSTMHRVVAPPGAIQNGYLPDRYSLPFFCGPDIDTIVECLPGCSSPSDPPKYPPTNALQHIEKRQEMVYSVDLD